MEELMADKDRIVAVLGASAKAERYSNRCVEMLLESGFTVIPVSLKDVEVCGVKAVKNLENINQKIDTLTIYLAPKHQKELTDSIIKLNPARVIFNPGTENELLAQRCRDKRIKTVQACTLVMLRTDVF